PPDPAPGRSAPGPWAATPRAGTRNCWPRPAPHRRARSCEQAVDIPARRRLIPEMPGAEQPEPTARLILDPVIVAHPAPATPPPFTLDPLGPLGQGDPMDHPSPGEAGRRTVG